tara:strand:+ start:1063 stop:1881 length:819 start_codon:yes stop_codon:yes gene_type:complete
MATEDYLDIDPPINGQNYVCLSFVSPEDVIEDRHAFNVSKYLQSIAKSEDKEFDKLMSQYTDFCYKHEDSLQKEFDERNNFKTSVRGIKVRGVYQSKQEAEMRAGKLHKSDSNFHVFVGQVGYWLPWNPCADKIEDETFADTQLNELMTKYKENNVNKDIFYEEQKRDKIKAAQEERLRAEKERKAQESLENVSEEPSVEDEPCADEPCADEPCADEPCVEEVSPEPEVEKKISEDEPCSVISEEPAPGGASDLERALTEEDPWMANKNRNA